jgi:hypothetical protein
MQRYFRPRAGRFGIHPIFYVVDLPANPATVNNTQSHRLGGPHRKAVPERFNVAQGTVGNDADGTILIRVKKWDASANAFVVLTDDVNLEGQQADETVVIPIKATLTDEQATIDEGDTLVADIVNNSAAIDTQPANVRVGVELAFLE